MASISGSVTIAGDPDDWIAVAWDADTHAYAGVATVSGGAYEITGLTAGKAYVVGCRPKSGPAWASSRLTTVNDYTTPSDTVTIPYLFKATSVTAGDEYFNDVTLLLPMDGDNNGTVFTDSKGHTITRNGNAITTTSVYKWGGSSALFDGSGDYLVVSDSSDYDMSDDFTIECWAKWNLNSESASPVFNIVMPSGNMILYKFGGNKLCLSISGANRITGPNTLTDTNWHYLALKRASNTLTLAMDGSQIGTYSYSTSMSPSSIQVAAWSAAGYYLDGYIDDFRITKNIARDIFSVPVAAFPASGLGMTGTSEPTWPLTLNSTVVDEDVTWTNMGRLVRPLLHGPIIAV